jgi:hypothetical protein
MNIDYSSLPGHMQGGMQRYIENRVPPGDFLYAVLTNDLIGAYDRADDVNSARLRDYALFLYNQAPRACYGSKENVAAWLEGEQDGN